MNKITINLKNFTLATFVVSAVSAIAAQIGEPNNLGRASTYQDGCAVVFVLSFIVLVVCIFMLIFRFAVSGFKLKPQPGAKIFKSPIAKKFRVLYIYAIAYLLLTQPFIIYRIEQRQTNAVAKAYPVLTLVSLISVITVTVLLSLYFVLAKNLSRLKLLLKVLLILEVAALIATLLKDIDTYNFIIPLIFTPFTYYVYRTVSGKRTLLI